MPTKTAASELKVAAAPSKEVTLALKRGVALKKARKKKFKPALTPTEKSDKKEKAEQIKREQKYKSIRVIRNVDFFGQEQVSVYLMDGEVTDALRNLDIECSYERTPHVHLSALIIHFEEINESTDECLKEMKEFLQFSAKDVAYTCKELVSKGIIQYNYLWYVFKKGTECFTYVDNELSAGKVISTKYQNTWAGSNFVIEVEQIGSNGKTFVSVHNNFKIRRFDKTLEISKLAVCPLDAVTKDGLIERGKTYEKYGINAHYCNYQGQIKINNWFGSVYYRADGRIIVDPVGSDRRDSETYRSREDDNAEEHDGGIPNDKLAFHVPYFKGFSFALKKWGEFAVSKVSAIQFNTKAFDTLVLDSEKKAIISSLVKNANNGFKDIIAGKSGGCIFLLHGPPGVGKTLTAEAIAESMQKPLYSVSIGELGINPTDLEKSLREILDIAESWGAVILIDEADIFLEARNEEDIVRNAMVGVFLRLLEYHQGVLFLTTNRVKNFDEAFHSRISVALHYKAHNAENRKKIWTNLLGAANITGINIDSLAKYDINGRQIKTTIRLAQALAHDNREEVRVDHIIKTISLQASFIKELAK